MKIKNKILSTLLGISTLASAEIYNVSPKDNWQEIIETAKYGDTVVMDIGRYDGSRFSRETLPEGVNLEGIIGYEDLYIEDKGWSPTTKASTVIEGDMGVMDVKGSNRISNIIFEKYTLNCVGDRYEILNNHFINYDDGQILVLGVTDGLNTLIDNNVFYNNHTVIFNGVATQGTVSPDSKIRNNKFIDNKRAIVTLWGLDIGSETEKGDNVFMSETNIVNYGTFEVPAKYNYWYGLKTLIEEPILTSNSPNEYIFLDNEEDIRKTILEESNKKIRNDYKVDIFPFNTQDFFEYNPPSSNDNWLLYESNDWYDKTKPQDLIKKIEDKR